MFTIAGRPAANVSNSLLGELVASTGHVLEEGQAGARSGPPARRPPPCPRRAGELDVRRRGPLELGAPLAVAHQHEGHVGEQPRRLDRGRQVVGLAHRAEVADDEAVAGGGGAGRNRSRSEAFGHQHDLPGRHAGRRSRRPGSPARARSPGERVDRPAARASVRRAAAAGCASAPIWIGASGQRSRTSKTSGARQRARGGERRQRDRERRRGRVDHVRARAAQRRRGGADREAPERQHALAVAGRGGAHVVGVGARARPRRRCRRPSCGPCRRLPSAPGAHSRRSGARTRTTACHPTPARVMKNWCR